MLEYLFAYLQTYIHDEEGQDLVEYALIIVLVALALVAALTALNVGIAGVFTRIVTALGLH